MQSKIRWLTIIRNQVVRFQPKGPHCTDEVKKQPPAATKLQAFDDVACQYHSSFDIGIMEFNDNCSRLEGKLKLKWVNYTRKVDVEDNNRLLAASLEIKLGAGTGIEKGPVQANLSADINGKLEWNETAVTNWEVSSEVGVSAGSNLGYKDKSIDIAGVKAQIGMNSGANVQGSGLLQNLKLK